jgi:16S rRNA processing protein RimM
VRAEGDNSGAQEDVVIARIARARGIRGEVACDVETDFPERFDRLERVTVWMPGEARLSMVIEDHWFHKGRVILKFEGVDTMSAAEQLVGGRLVVAESDRDILDEDQFFEYEIVGAEVFTADGVSLGRVSRLMRTGGTDLLVVEGETKRELLIPFADDICTEVDVRAKRITVELPEGLLDL